MINNKKGKEHMPRPLKVRIIAFLTALAMVFSVIYFGNRSKSVEADTPASTITDGDYVSGVYNNSGDTEDITIKVPATGIKFAAPTDSSAIETGNTTLYTRDNTNYYLDEGSVPGTEDITEVAVSVEFKRVWRQNVDGSGELPATISDGNTIYLLRYNLRYYEGSNDYTPVDAASYEYEKLKSISIVSYDPEADLKFNDSANPATLEDTDVTETASVKYYGTVSYEVAKDGESSPTTYTSLSAVNQALAKPVTSDGSYTITKNIVAPASGGSASILSTSVTGTVNNYLLTGYKASYKESASATPTTITGSMDAATYAITVPASGTLSAAGTIDVEFSTDSAIDTSKITVTPSGASVSTPTVSKGTGNTYTFNVAADPEKTNNKKVDYKVELTDDTINEEFTVTINYSDGHPVFSEEKIGSDDVTATQEVVNTETVELSAKVKVADSKASLDGGVVLVNTTSGTDETVATLTPSSDKVTNTTTLVHGNNTFKMKATSKYEGGAAGLSGQSKVFDIFYDDTNPYINGDLSASQGSSAVTVEKTDSTYSMTVSAMTDLDLSFNVADMQKDFDDSDIDGSGVESVTVDGSAATVTSGSVSYTIAKDESKAGGATRTVPIVVKDNAGNKSDYTINITYLNEKADIKAEFNKSFVDGSHYIKWDEGSKNVTVTFTIDTMFELADEANEGIMLTVDGATTNITGEASRTPTASGYTYTVSYTYPNVSKADYVVSLKTKNINGCETTYNAKVISIDITDPTITVDTMDSSWHYDLFLNVSVGDASPSSGFDYVDATGTKEAKYTTNPFIAEVNKSTSTAGTPVSFTAYDKAGNKSAEFKWTYKIDQDKPALTLQIGGKDYKDVDGKVINVADPKIDFTMSDALSGIINPNAKSFKVDGNTYPVAYAGKSLSEIIGGTVDPSHQYTVEIHATDQVGNSETYTTKFTCDNKPPEITGQINNTAKKAKYPTCFNENVSLTVTVTDHNINTIDIVDTEGHNIKKSSTQDGNKTIYTINATSEGKYNIKVTATDKAGLSTTWTQAFTIDKTEPDVTTQLNGSNYTASNSYNTTVTTGVVVNDTNEDPSDVVVTMLRDKPEGGQETINKTGKGPFTVSDDGFYKVTYVVTDKAGNKTTKEIGFTVDNTAPVNNLYVLTDNPSKVDSYHNNYVNVHNVFTEHSNQENYAYGQYYNTDVTVELNYFDYNLNSVYVTDRGAELSPTWTEKNGYGKATITLSSEGYHEIKIWTDDLAGNSADDTEVGQKIRFTIDKTSPVISTTLNGAGYAEGSGVRYLTTNGTVGVTVSDTNVDEKDLKRIYRITPPGGATRTGEDYVSPGSETYQEEADYQVQYVAVDKAGNSSSVRTVEFRVDKTAPQLSISSVGATSTAGSVSISFNVKEAFYWDMNSVTIKIYKKKDGSGETLEKTIDMKPKSSNDSTSYTFTEDAEYRIEFTAEDKCGNKATTDYTFIKDGTAPRIVLSGVGNYDKTDKNVELMLTIDEDFYTSNKVTLKGTRTDIDGKKNEITFDDFAPNRSKVSELKQLFDKDGIYDIEVTSVDKAGNKSTKNVHFTIDKTPPKIGDLSKYDKKMLREFKWDIDLNKLVTDLTVCEITLYLDGVEYDGVSPIEDGSHVLKVEAVDEMGHKSSKEVTFVLDSKGPNIIVSNVEDQDVFYEAKDIGVSVQLDEDMLDEVQLNGSAVTVTDNQATMKIDKKGDYTLTAKAHDEAGNESSISIKFTFGSEMNLWMIIGIAGGIILLLLILLLIIRKKRSW